MELVMNSAKNAITRFKNGESLNYLTMSAVSARYIIFELATLDVKFTIKNYGLGVRRITAEVQ